MEFFTLLFPYLLDRKISEVDSGNCQLAVEPSSPPRKEGNNDNVSWKDDWVKQIKVSVGKTLRCKATTLDSCPCRGTVPFAMAVIHLFCDLTANRDFQNRYDAEV